MPIRIASNAISTIRNAGLRKEKTPRGSGVLCIAADDAMQSSEGEVDNPNLGFVVEDAVQHENHIRDDIAVHVAALEIGLFVGYAANLQAPNRRQTCDERESGRQCRLHFDGPGLDHGLDDDAESG